jgi:hypothetical protein
MVRLLNYGTRILRRSRRKCLVAIGLLMTSRAIPRLCGSRGVYDWAWRMCIMRGVQCTNVS